MNIRQRAKQQSDALALAQRIRIHLCNLVTEIYTGMGPKEGFRLTVHLARDLTYGIADLVGGDAEVWRSILPDLGKRPASAVLPIAVAGEDILTGKKHLGTNEGG